MDGLALIDIDVWKKKAELPHSCFLDVSVVKLLGLEGQMWLGWQLASS